MAEKSNKSPIKYFTEHSFLKTGFLKKDRFFLSFENAGIVEKTFNLHENLLKDNGWLVANVASVSLPAFTIESELTPYQDKIVKRTLGDLSITFYESYDMKIRREMYKWIDGMCADDSDIFNYKRNYFSDSVINLRIRLIYDNGDESDVDQSDYFTEVYPISIGNVDFDIGNENELGQVVVQFKYRHHQYGILNSGTADRLKLLNNNKD